MTTTVNDAAYLRAAEKVIAGCLRLQRAGLVTGTAGNISVRLGDGRIAISPGRTPYETLTPQDISLVAADGTLLGGRPASSETGLHLRIYERTGYAAVVHTHSPLATAVGTVADELPAIHYAIHRLGDAIPVAPYATFGSAELAENVASRIDEHTKAVLMRNHGVAVAGTTLMEALVGAETVEWLAQLYWNACQLGRPGILDAAQLTAVRAQVVRLNYSG